MGRVFYGVLVLGLTLTAGARPAATQSGAITGRVSDAITGQPLASAGSTYFYVHLVDSLGHFVTRVETNAAGDYALADVAPGSYTLFTSTTAGYVNRTSDGTSCGATCRPQKPVIVTAGTVLTIDFALDPSAIIGGQVVDASARFPMGNIPVVLYDAHQRQAGSALTNAAGFYAFETGIAAGTYYVVARPFGTPQKAQAYSGLECDESCRLVDATPIRVAVNQSIRDINFLLTRRTGSISGRVTDTAGAPLSGAVVRATRHPTGRDAFVATTDSAGRYTIANVRDGIYGLSAQGTASQQVLPQIYAGIDTPFCEFVTCLREGLTGTPVAVAGGAAVTGIDFSLAARGAFSGRLTRDGVGISGLVSVYDSAGRRVSVVATDPAGAYTTLGLSTGTYFATGEADVIHVGLYRSLPCERHGCAVVSGTPISVTAGATTTGIDIDLPPSGRGSISGVVRSTAGAPLRAVVSVWRGDEGYGTTTSAADGSYTIQNIPAGSYRVSASNAGSVREWYPNACAPCGERGTAVSVGQDAAVANIDFQLDPESTITGAVTLVPALGSPIVGIQVLRADGTVAGETSAGGGTYSVTGLPAGTYFIRAVNHTFAIKNAVFGGDYAPALYDNKECLTADCPIARGTPIVVAAGTTVTGIDLTMRFGAVISGRARTEGQTVSGSPLNPHVVPAVRAYAEDGRLAGHIRRTGNEEYSIVGLAPGRYYLKASADGYTDVIYKDLSCSGCSPLQGTPVTVGEGEQRSDVDFLMFAAGSITGVVRDASGAPVVDVAVSVYAEGGTLVRAVRTDRVGGYALFGLSVGRYFVATENLQGFADEVFDNVACGSCDPLRGRPVEVTGGAVTPGIDFTLERGALVTGTVKDAGGAPVGPASIEFYNASGQRVARTRSLTAGTYSVSVPAGTNFAKVEARDGFGAQLYKDIPCPGGVCDPTGGTPIVAPAGTVQRNIDFSMPVCGRIVIEPPGLPPAAVGVAYSSAATATGGGAFTYSVQQGRLPPGLSLHASTGALSGTPSAAGQYSLSIAAADAAGCGASRSYVIDVTSCTPSLANTAVGTPTYDLRGSGGTIMLSLDASCPAPATFNSSWLTRGRDLGAGLLEIVVAPNPGGRRTGTVTIGNRTVTVNQAAAASAVPFGIIDTPADGAVVSGSIAIGGWVLDDLRVTRVDVYRSNVAGEGSALVFIGQATIVPGARPDVERAFPEFPYGNRAGWGYLLLTNMLPNAGNGTFTLVAMATDTEGHQTTLGSRTIVANNATATQPFGAIDTPQQGETISGTAYVNFGWALTPRPKTIPRNGSTVTVYIDGAAVGNASYNHFREDIAALFPNLNNSDGAVGFRTIDTTTLADGLHTIAWVVSDDSGAAEGIGSRYFTVANGTAQFTSGVLTPPALRAAPASASVRQVFARPLEPVELDLSSGEPASCRTVFRGVERVGAEQRALPVGSSLDRERGVFRWHPGPGFLGTYQLSFDVGQCDGRVTRIDVDVRIDRGR